MILQVFAKAPIPGKVKTRLIPKLGAEGAADLHKQLVKHCLQTFSGLFSIQLWCAPNDTLFHPFFCQCQSDFGVSLHRQQGIDLGERMAYALASTAPTPTVLIGSDCPNLKPQTISHAFTALQQDYDVVIAPAEDGGYVLIGGGVPEIFTDIPWGSSQVFSLTQARLRALGLRWHQLPYHWDVDRPEDVERWLSMEKRNSL